MGFNTARTALQVQASYSSGQDICHNSAPVMWVGLPTFLPGRVTRKQLRCRMSPLDLRGEREREHGRRRRLRLTHARKYFLLPSFVPPSLPSWLAHSPSPLLKIMSGARAAFVRSPVRSFVRICGCCNELKRNKESFRERRTKRRRRETNDAAPRRPGHARSRVDFGSVRPGIVGPRLVL